MSFETAPVRRDWQQLMAEIHLELRGEANPGRVADYIPALAQVDPLPCRQSPCPQCLQGRCPLLAVPRPVR